MVKGIDMSLGTGVGIGIGISISRNPFGNVLSKLRCLPQFINRASTVMFLGITHCLLCWWHCLQIGHLF
jgi:hypothetical protein